MALKTFDSFAKAFKKSGSVNRLLVTGASGRIGVSLLPYLKQIYGNDNILLTDIKNDRNLDKAHYKTLDVRDKDAFLKTIKEFKADTIIHLASIDATKGESDPQLCLEVNSSGTLNAIELSKEHKLRMLYTSSLSTFGTDTPRRNAPSLTFQRPNTMGGVSETYMELFGSYYHYKHKTDFRCLRLTNLISPVALKHGVFKDTTQIYLDALSKGRFTSHLKAKQYVPSIYIDDLATGLVQLLEADGSKLKLRIYNLSSTTFSVGQQVDSIKKHIPGFSVDYKPWEGEIDPEQYPQSVDDFDARNDFGYSPQYDLDKITSSMLAKKH